MDENKLINELEGKIINQLLHQIGSQKGHLSRFKIRKDNKKSLHFSVILLLSFFVSLLYLLNFFRWGTYISETFAPELITYIIVVIFPLIASIAIAPVSFSIILYYLLKLQDEKQILKSIKVQGSEIALFGNENDLYFDKYLDEILHLLKVSGADVIIFDDLDRFKNNKIFVKLREINYLLNKKSDKPVRFVYLLQDHMFVSKDKTKLFDFILPIVPVIDSSNSYKQLIDMWEEAEYSFLNDFDHHFLKRISLYVDDMRILKNVTNEFLIYNQRIRSTDQDINKLFSIILFKNLFSEDFINLQ